MSYANAYEGAFMDIVEKLPLRDQVIVMAFCGALAGEFVVLKRVQDWAAKNAPYLAGVLKEHGTLRALIPPTE
jgi:hypothetical protein